MDRESVQKQIGKPAGSFSRGFFSIFGAMGYIINNRGLAKFLIIPFLLNIAVLTGIFAFAYYSAEPLIAGFLAGDSFFLSVLRAVIRPLMLFVLALFCVFAYSILGSIITAPFNDLISQKVEEINGEQFNVPFSLMTAVGDVFRIALNTVKFVLLIIAVNMLLLLLNLLPFIGTLIHQALNFLITSFFFGFQFFDFPLERRRLSFGRKIKILWRHRYLAIGLGSGFFLMTFIPVVGFLGLCLGSVGAALLFAEHIKPNLDRSGS